MILEPNLRAMILDRELGKNVALVSNLRPNARDPQSVGEASNDDAQREPKSGVSSHI